VTGYAGGRSIPAPVAILINLMPTPATLGARLARVSCASLPRGGEEKATGAKRRLLLRPQGRRHMRKVVTPPHDSQPRQVVRTRHLY
jgi:hypothetical protein